MTKCSALWNHARVHVDGSVWPCCKWLPKQQDKVKNKIPKIKNGLTNAVNSDYFNSIRQRMDSNEYIEECRQCDTSDFPLRDYFNRKYKNTSNITIVDLETSFSNHCNLACRMCGEVFSSKWEEINEKTVTLDTDGADLDLYDIDFTKIKKIKLVGGEPMIHKKHVELIEKLINNKDITLQYHTNCTIYPSKKIINYWKKIKSVEIFLSIDSIDNLGDYARPGNNWANIHSNIQKFKELSKQNKNIVIKTHSVISILNITSLVDLLDYVYDTSPYSFYYELLLYPNHLSIYNFENKEKLYNILKIARTQIHNRFDKQSFQIKANLLLDSCEKAIEAQPNSTYSIEYIQQKESKLDDYFGQSFESTHLKLY